VHPFPFGITLPVLVPPQVKVANGVGSLPFNVFREKIKACDEREREEGEDERGFSTSHALFFQIAAAAVLLLAP